jgi:predicted amidohydrolase
VLLRRAGVCRPAASFIDTVADRAGPWDNRQMRPDDPQIGPSNVTVACSNFDAIPRDKAATALKMIGVIAEAAALGADLVVFPELALNTWGGCDDCAALHQPCEWHLGQAETAQGNSFDTIAAAARTHGIHVIYGFEELDQEDPSKIYNSASVVSPDGLIGTYRKLHLGIPLETDRFSPGSELPVFETELGPIGISICYDFYNNPELCRVLALKGARILVNPTGRSDLPRARENLEDATLVRAQENLVYAASANRVGSSHGDTTWAGGSVIGGPRFPGFGVVLAQAGEQSELIIADLDFEELGKWYDWLPWREWRAGPQREITRLVADELSKLADAPVVATS